MKLPDWITKLAGIMAESTEKKESVDISGVGILTNSNSGLSFQFSDQYLISCLTPIDISVSRPEVFKDSRPQYSYVTNRHVGAQNFVVNWYPKVATPEGIVENVALVEQGDNRFYIVPECDEIRFNKICRKLTPTLNDLGYAYVDGQIQKSAKVTMMFFDTPAEAADYQKKVTPSAPPELKPAPPLPDKLQEAGKELLKEQPTTLNKIKTEEAGEKLEEKASLEVEAKKKSEKKSDELAPNDPARNAVFDVRLSKWDEQSAPEKSQSAESVISVSYCPDRAAYAVKFPQGTRLNLSYETVKSYLLNEGYQLEEANKHLEDAKKSEVVLRKEAKLKKSANLEKFIESVKGESKLRKIANLLSSSASRRNIFLNILSRSLENGEIEKNDLQKYQIALTVAETANTPEAWLKLAEVSNSVFEKANNG